MEDTNNSISKAPPRKKGFWSLTPLKFTILILLLASELFSFGFVGQFAPYSFWGFIWNAIFYILVGGLRLLMYPFGFFSPESEMGGLVFVAPFSLFYIYFLSCGIVYLFNKARGK